MIKFLGRHGGEGAALLGLALSDEDVERLRNGDSLSVEVKDLGAEIRAPGSKVSGGTVVLFFANESAVERRMSSMGLIPPPGLLPKPRFRALPGKGPRRRTSAATSVGRRRSRSGT
jgi:hypothetical protein